jgi:hypothetical protein
MCVGFLLLTIQPSTRSSVNTEGHFTFAIAGNAKRVHIMAWSALPVQIQELVLAKLSLRELAQTSATCPAWEAFLLCRRLALLQCQQDLMMTVFGEDRVGCLALYFTRFLRGRTVNEGYGLRRGYSGSRMTGHNLQTEWLGLSPAVLEQLEHNVEGYSVWIHLPQVPPKTVSIHVPSPGHSCVLFEFSRRRGTLKIVMRVAHGDVPGLAMLQQVLIWGVLEHALQNDHVTIVGYRFNARFSRTRLDNQTAPLRSMVEQCPNWRISGWGRG